MPTDSQRSEQPAQPGTQLEGRSPAPDCSAPIAPLQSAFASIQTARRDCEAAGDFLGAMEYAEAVVWIDNAITGLQSAKAKVIASQNTSVSGSHTASQKGIES